MFDWFSKLNRKADVVEKITIDEKGKLEASPENTSLAKCKELLRKGNSLLSTGDLNGALGVYQEAVHINANSPEAHLNLGFVLRSLNRNKEATAALQQALTLNPKLEDAYFILGGIFQETGKEEEAIANYEKVIALNPGFKLAYNALFDLLLDKKQIDDAGKVIAKAINTFPDQAEFYFLQGHLYYLKKELESSKASFEKSIEIQPDFYPPYVHLGNIFKDLHDLVKAQEFYEKAILVNPDVPDPHNNLGALYQDQDDIENAEACYRKALEIDPNFVDALSNLGGVLSATSRVEEAVSIFRRALALKPDSADINNYLGSLLRRYGHLKEAEAACQRAIALDPNCFDAYNSYATVLNDQGRKQEAAEYFERAIEVNPKFGLAFNNLGVLYQEQGEIEKALDCYKKASQLRPDFYDTKENLLYLMLHLHDWEGLESIALELRRAVSDLVPRKANRIAPFSFLATPGSTPEEQKKCASNWANRIQDEMRFKIEAQHFEFKRTPKSRINIGYLSADFRNHPVAHLMARVFKLHDRERFRITAYSIGPSDDSGMREKLIKSFDSFRDLEVKADEEIAKQIYQDGIDILVNLTGYTQFARSEVFTLRAAPIQVNYLGYPGTLGGDYFDYLIADAYIIPPELEKNYVEKIKCLPDTYMPRDDSCQRLPASPRNIWNLPEHAFVFCSFNQPTKITPSILDIWCRLLKMVPDSVLWLPATRALAEANLAKEVEARGVSSERIIRAPRAVHMEDHLARMQCADLFLDTFPYNAHTTCSDALWMGLPVVTCVGDTFPSRVAGSLLTTADLSELVTHNLEQYFELALELATNKTKYEEIRGKVIASQNSEALFNCVRFTRNLEKIYEEIWNEYLDAGEKSE